MYARGRIIHYDLLAAVLSYRAGERAFGDAYAQSIAMTGFLVERLGEDRFWEMIHSLNGQSFDLALAAYAGLSPQQLWEEWRHSLWRVALVTSLVSGFTLFQIMAILSFWAWWRKHRRGRALLRAWEAEGDTGSAPSYADLEADESFEDVSVFDDDYELDPEMLADELEEEYYDDDDYEADRQSRRRARSRSRRKRHR